MLRDIVELKIKMLKLGAIFLVEFCYNLATIDGGPLHNGKRFSENAYQPDEMTLTI